jgi:hypothetical protein
MLAALRFLTEKRRFLLLYGLALVIRLVFAVPFIHDWDGFVFAESAKNFLAGETPYMTVLKNDPSIYPDSDEPMIQQWYAYPPLPLLLFTFPVAIVKLLGLSLPAVAQSVLLKIPFIFGDLLAAWLLRKFLEVRSARLAKRAESLTLFNPLLIWVSSAWGMFDIWMANFLLMFLLSLRKKYVWRAGVALALACTTKLFPVFFLPVIAIHSLRKIRNYKAQWKLFTAFTATLAVIVIPFFVTSPRGFLNQNLLMHLQRPPQGLSIPALFDFFQGIYQFPVLPITAIATILMYSSMLIVFLLALVRLRGREETLLASMVAIYIPILIFNKVTNEQYFVLLIILLTALLFIPSSVSHFSHRILYLTKAAATYSVLIAASLLGFHFLGFLLPDITHSGLNTSTNHLVFFLSRHFNLPLYTYPDSIWTFYNLPAAIASLAMVPFIALGLLITTIIWREAWEVRHEIRSELGSLVYANLIRLKNLKLLAPLLILLIGGFAVAPTLKAYASQHNLFTAVSLLQEDDLQPLPKEPRVGAFYNVWWNNFSHYKDFPYGDWGKTTLQPQAGYYTSKNSYFVQHIKQMKEAGIDFAVIPYHLYDRKRYLNFGHYAEQMGLHYAPMIEIVDILGFDEYRPTSADGDKILGFSLSESSRKALENVIISSLDISNRQALLHIQDKPVVFTFFGHWFVPSWDDEFKRILVDRVVDKYRQSSDVPLVAISEAWGVNVDSTSDLIASYPANIQKFNEDNIISRDYKEAFQAEYKLFWEKIRQRVESEVGPIFMISTYPPLDPSAALDPSSQKRFVVQFDDFGEVMEVFDGEFFYGISSNWYAWRYFNDSSAELKLRWEEQVARQVDRDRQKDIPVMLTVTPAYDERFVRPDNPFEVIPPQIGDVSTYDWTWETALQHKPDYVLITSWNEFFEGTAIEPSQEYGDFYIRETAEWSTKFKKIMN